MNTQEKQAALEKLARDRAVRGWAFRLGPEDKDMIEAIRAFLAGGLCPPIYRSRYAKEREQLRLGPKDWYEAFADAAHSIGKHWPDLLTDEETKACEAAADSVAVRPESEKDRIEDRLTDFDAWGDWGS